jgi:alpha,alpha-trehalase
VLTRTAGLHARAWKGAFDAFLRRRAEGTGRAAVPFDAEDEYRRLVDGRPRIDGVHAFLAARGIALPRGQPQDLPGDDTEWALGNRKNEIFRALLAREGAELHPGALELVRRLRAAGFATAVVSASRNAEAVLRSIGALDLFDVRIDGVLAQQRGLRGKPAPDAFLSAAGELRVSPRRAAVFEDADAGVEAGRAGGFALVVGVDRGGRAEALREHGAQVVIDDLRAVAVAPTPERGGVAPALANLDAIRARLRGRPIAVFLDFDGTLAPIVERPELAAMAAPMRAAVRRLARRCPVAVVSGRDLADVRARVGLRGLNYAGSHGFDIAGPRGLRHAHPMGVQALPRLDAAERELRQALAAIDGAIVERKRFSIAVHFRLVPGADDVAAVERAVDAALQREPGLRRRGGKKVFELLPDIDWDKGAAVRWLLAALGLARPEVLPIYVGDDLTDEDAFRAIAGRGLGIAVLDSPRPTTATYRVDDPAQVCTLLGAIAAALEESR